MFKWIMKRKLKDEVFPNVNAIIHHTLSHQYINKTHSLCSYVTVRSKPDLYKGDLFIFMPAKSNDFSRNVFFANVKFVKKGDRGWNIYHEGLYTGSELNYANLHKSDVAEYFGDVKNSRTIQYV